MEENNECCQKIDIFLDEYSFTGNGGCLFASWCAGKRSRRPFACGRCSCRMVLILLTQDLLCIARGAFLARLDLMMFGNAGVEHTDAGAMAGQVFST